MSYTHLHEDDPSIETFRDVLIFHSPRPLMAATSLCAERGVGLLVFGPSRAATGRWRYRSWSRRVRTPTPCLVWLPED